MQIRAAVSRKGQDIPIIEGIEIGPPRAGEILVRIVACGICHTDLGAQAGTVRTPKPIVLGHEGAGVVEKVGEDVRTISPGDHVILTGSSCGHCANCKREMPSYCDDTMRRNFGGLRPDGTTALSSNTSRIFGHFLGQSSFAQYAVAEERSAIKVAGDLPLPTLAPLGCSVSTGAGAIFNAFAARPEQTLAILGVGSVGLSAVMAARILGLKRIVAVDRDPARLELASALGATDIVAATGGDIVGRIRAMLPKGVDFSLNTTVDGDMFVNGVACLAMGGVAGFVSAPAEPVSFQVQALLTSGRTLQAILGSHAAPANFVPRLLEYFRRGDFPIDRLVKTYSFDEIGTAFLDLGAARAVKPVLVM